MAVVNPLTEKHCNDLDCVLQSIPNIEDTIKACEECGMDLSAERERLEAQRQFATSVKRKFNPLAE